jgi:hypothetical protein
MTKTTEQTLAAWLGERLDEDEAAAWHDVDCQFVRHGLSDPGFGWACDCGVPARVLADVAAKRRIVALVTGDGLDDDDPQSVAGMECQIEGEWGLSTDSPSPLSEITSFQILLALAAPYRDCPGFREEWSA